MAPQPIHDTSPSRIHSIGHTNCPACEQARDRMIAPDVLASLLFGEAAQIWLESHSRLISDGSVRNYKQNIARLSEFFSELRLTQIHIGHLEQYQKLRKAGPSITNHELNCLSQILLRAGIWANLAPYYKPLLLPKSEVGVALAEVDERRLFRVAASKPRWKLAFWCSILTANTTAGAGEIRHLRLRDIDLPGRSIRIREGTKNQFRKRVIPLNDDALWALRQLVDRAHGCGASEPDHYLLPHRAPNGQKGFDPTRPLFSWRTAWNKLRVAANLPTLRMYDLRHHAITRLLEDGQVSERTVIDLAGHVSNQMLNTYSHIRMQKKRAAVDGLAKKGPESIAANRLILVKK